MAKKTYTATTTMRPAQPRSKRLREHGVSSVSIVGGGSWGGADGPTSSIDHSHGNLQALDALSIDKQDYLYITQIPEATEANPEPGIMTNKVKSGYADESKHAETSDIATHAATSDEAAHAADADRWADHAFDDYMDQPLRKTDPVQFKRVTTPEVVTPDFNPGGLVGSGAGLVHGANGKTVLEVDDLFVRRNATFNEVIINQASHIGGRTIYSAAGMECTQVVVLANTYRCYFDTKNGQRANLWKLDDQAYCQRYSPNGSIITKYYWRLVVGVGADYIDLSMSEADGTGVPAEGDDIIQMGNRIDPSRQSMLEIDTTQGGQMTLYSGIDSFELANKNEVAFGINPQTGKPFIYAYGDMFFGDRDLNSEDATYITFQTAAGETRRRMRICADLVIGKNSTGLSNLSEWAGVEQKMNDTQAAADAATAKLTDWASDDKISPTEKTALKQQQRDIQSEYAEILTNAGRYSVATASYTAAYAAAIAAFAKYIAPEPESIPIEGDYANISAYYGARQTILEQIATAAKVYSEKLVGDVQVGDRNLLLKSADGWKNNYYNIAAINLGDYKPSQGEECTVVIKGKLGHDKYFFALFNSGLNVQMTNVGSEMFGNDDIAVHTFKWNIESASNTYVQFLAYPSVGAESQIEWVKIVSGNKTSKVWTQAPEDAQAEIDAAKSSADAANAAIAAMNDDGIFDIPEKQSIRTQWEHISGISNTVDNPTASAGGSYIKTVNTATQLSVPTVSITAAFDALRAYLNALELFTNSNKSGFNRAEMAQRFTAYYDAETELLTLIAKRQSVLQGAQDKDTIAKDLGYADYAEMESAAKAGKTIIEGGKIRTELLEASHIVAMGVDVVNGNARVKITPDEGMTLLENNKVTAKFTGQQIGSVFDNIPVNSNVLITEQKNRFSNIPEFGSTTLTLATGTISGTTLVPVTVEIPPIRIFAQMKLLRSKIEPPTRMYVHYSINGVVQTSFIFEIDRFEAYEVIVGSDWEDRPIYETRYRGAMEKQITIPASFITANTSNRPVLVQVGYSFQAQPDPEDVWDNKLYAQFPGSALEAAPVSKYLDVGGLSFNSTFYGNGLIFSKSTNQLVGMCATSEGTELIARAGNHGLKVDQTGVSHLKSDGTGWDNAGLLCGYHVNEGGTFVTRFGIKDKPNNGCERENQGRYKLTHNIGHKDYVASVVVAAAGWDYINITDKTETYVVVEIRFGTGGFIDKPFMILFFGKP